MAAVVDVLNHLGEAGEKSELERENFRLLVRDLLESLGKLLFVLFALDAKRTKKILTA
jgi:hypothetical protein